MIPWHVIERGNNRAVCFYAEDDYGFYLDLDALASQLAAGSVIGPRL